jgi:hypothetical protein
MSKLSSCAGKDESCLSEKWFYQTPYKDAKLDHKTRKRGSFVFWFRDYSEIDFVGK